MNPQRKIKKMVNVLLEKYGHTITHSSIVPSFERFVSRLRDINVIPQTVVDIGVAYGTPWLYDAFPKAQYHLVEPTRESLPYMKEWQTKINADIHSVALGENEGEIEIKVRPEISGSSIYDEIGQAEIQSSYIVPIVRFDQLFPILPGVTLVKIDVQGAELSVLKGMESSLKNIDYIICETSLIATLSGNAPEFSDIVFFLKQKGFSLYDFVGMTRRPLDRALAQVDAVFVPDESPLRSDRRWRA